MTKKYNDIENQNIKHNADWSTFKDSLELSQEELAQIDLKVEELSLTNINLS
jgi:hypothetical protein